MASFKRFEDIEGWQLARSLNQRIWEILSSGRFGKDFALCDQINRAAGSAMDNIVEPRKRNETADGRRWTQIIKELY
jgi:four helix bundle protein